MNNSNNDNSRNAANRDFDLAGLAEVLARNLITNSFAIGMAGEPIQVLMKNGKLLGERRTRNILVLGAGASHNVNPKIKLASDAIKIVRDRFCQEYGKEFIRFIDKKVTELTQSYALKQDEFETQLLACSTLDNELVLSVLSELYCHKHPVSLFYEIVAHLFKHRFIDVIINFNFDEMLDNAIEEEMMDSQYHFIYSDGHCPENNRDLLYDNRLSCPIYIKPHGTISHPSTLRFTREAYYKSPTRIKETLGYLIAGINDSSTFKKGEGHRPECLPVNLIVAGFGLRSSEFNAILSEKMEKGRCQLYYFDLTKPGSDSITGKLPEEIDCFTEDNSCLFPVRDKNYGDRTLDDWFLLLWKEIRGSFNTNSQPKDISRHVVLHEIFNPATEFLIEKSYPLIQYFHDRVLVEFAIEILNCSDGLINLRQIKESRIQKYYYLYRKKKGEKQLFDFLKLFGLKMYKGYVKDTWYYNPEDPTVKENIMSVILKEIFDKIKGYLKNNNRREPFSEYWKNLLSPTKLFLNINTTVKNNYINVFQNSTENDILNTDTKWIYVFQNYFLSEPLNRQWNLVLSISETGGIFNAEEIRNTLKGKKLMIISAYDANTSKHRKRDHLLNVKLKNIRPYILNNKGYAELRILPFRQHNQHVVLFTRVQDRKLELVGGIYYGRRNMSKRVTPIHINDQDDLHELLAIFINYWDRVSKDDNIDLIKKAICDDNITPDIKNLARHDHTRTFEDVRAEIIEAFYSDRS